MLPHGETPAFSDAAANRKTDVRKQILKRDNMRNGNCDSAELSDGGTVLFERRANGSTLAGVRTALNKSGDSAKIAHAAALAPIIELENRLNESLIVADDIINFYFRDFEDLTSGVSGDNRAMLLFKLFICKSKPLDELIDDMLAMSDREFAYAAVFGMGGRSEVTMTESEASLEDYFE